MHHFQPVPNLSQLHDIIKSIAHWEYLQPLIDPIAQAICSFAHKPPYRLFPPPKGPYCCSQIT